MLTGNRGKADGWRCTEGKNILSSLLNRSSMFRIFTMLCARISFAGLLVFLLATSMLLSSCRSADASAATATPDRPNFVIIMADDLGYSDISCYGSEIPTPNLDRLAADGVKFTQFYNAARCCPSRAALLTGVFPHQAGMGGMVKRDINQREPENPYQGWLSQHTATLAEVLRAGGYRTYHSGKWHVGEERPDWPLQRGFEKYFGLISGANSYYRLLPNRLILEGNEPYEIPDDFYFTDAISDYGVRYLQEHDASQPFLLYLAYTAPHWPIHAPAEEIERFKHHYRIGWDSLRAERLERQINIGLLPATTQLSPRDPAIPAWTEAEDKEGWIQKMATYAAMVSIMDQGIGRIIAQLEASGQLDNTVIMFLSDNGACHEELGGRMANDLEPEALEYARSAPIGAPGSYVAYGKPWANVGNTPFRLYKSFIHEGGISTPFIVHYPQRIRQPLQTDAVGHIIDLMPTCLELAGVDFETSPAAAGKIPLEGKSLLPLLDGNSRPGHEFLAWEHFDSRGIRQGDWKLVWSKSDSEWELYNIAEDRTEMNNLISAYPERAEALLDQYDRWAGRVGVAQN